jgi:hypothetical protein
MGTMVNPLLKGPHRVRFLSFANSSMWNILSVDFSLNGDQITIDFYALAI